MAILCASIIGYQDFKYRAVLWFVFPLLAIALGIVHFLNVETSFFYWSLPINFIVVSIVVFLLYLFATLIAKKKFMNHSLGLGDILFFFAFAMGYPTMTFIILFVFSLFFALFSYFIFKKNMSFKTVPLAGLMSVFLIAILSMDIFFKVPSLYIL